VRKIYPEFLKRHGFVRKIYPKIFCFDNTICSFVKPGAVMKHFKGVFMKAEKFFGIAVLLETLLFVFILAGCMDSGSGPSYT